MTDTPKTFTAWVTKYALTSGIKRVRARHTGIGAMIEDVADRFSGLYHGEGRDWHRTREAAVARAEAMRTAKIASLRKQIAKLEAMTFSAEGE